MSVLPLMQDRCFLRHFAGSRPSRARLAVETGTIFETKGYLLVRYTQTRDGELEGLYLVVYLETGEISYVFWWVIDPWLETEGP